MPFVFRDLSLLQAEESLMAGTLASLWYDDMLREWKFKIEIKPSLGDDYPTVLRQMRASGSDVLLVGEFRSAAIDLEQLEKIFDTAGCRVVTLSEIDAVVLEAELES